MADIFDEVSADLQAERARALFVRYGGVLVVAFILVLAGVGIYQWNKARVQKEDQRVAALFITATNAASTTMTDLARRTAIQDFQTVEQQNHPAYTALAKLNEASLRYDGGDRAGALILWDQVAGDGSIPASLRDLSMLLWVQHQVDSADPALLAGRLSPLLAPSNEWHALASEEMALLELRQGQTAEARDRLSALEADATASNNVRARASALLAGLGA